jgi:hypothetical protein
MAEDAKGENPLGLSEEGMHQLHSFLASVSVHKTKTELEKTLRESEINLPEGLLFGSFFSHVMQIYFIPLLYEETGPDDYFRINAGSFKSLFLDERETQTVRHTHSGGGGRERMTAARGGHVAKQAPMPRTPSERYEFIACLYGIIESEEILRLVIEAYNATHSV